MDIYECPLCHNSNKLILYGTCKIAISKEGILTNDIQLIYNDSDEINCQICNYTAPVSIFRKQFYYELGKYKCPKCKNMVFNKLYDNILIGLDLTTNEKVIYTDDSVDLICLGNGLKCKCGYIDTFLKFKCVC